MDKSTFAIESSSISFPKQNSNYLVFFVIETLPNGNKIKHGIDAENNPFPTEAEAQLWIVERT